MFWVNNLFELVVMTSLFLKNVTFLDAAQKYKRALEGWILLFRCMLCLGFLLL
jgi:hypothetical protein